MEKKTIEEIERELDQFITWDIPKEKLGEPLNIRYANTPCSEPRTDEGRLNRSLRVELGMSEEEFEAECKRLLEEGQDELGAGNS